MGEVIVAFLNISEISDSFLCPLGQLAMKPAVKIKSTSPFQTCTFSFPRYIVSSSPVFIQSPTCSTWLYVQSNMSSGKDSGASKDDHPKKPGQSDDDSHKSSSSSDLPQNRPFRHPPSIFRRGNGNYRRLTTPAPPVIFRRREEMPGLQNPSNDNNQAAQNQPVGSQPAAGQAESQPAENQPTTNPDNQQPVQQQHTLRHRASQAGQRLRRAFSHTNLRGQNVAAEGNDNQESRTHRLGRRISRRMSRIFTFSGRSSSRDGHGD